jgi:hypothetical protein
MHLPLRRAGRDDRRHRGDRDSHRRPPQEHHHRHHRRHRRGSYHRHRHRRGDHRCLHRDHGHRDRAGARLRPRRGAGHRDGRREPDGVRQDVAAYCPATCQAAGHLDGAPADAESAAQPAAPRRTGCCRRAESARRAWARRAQGPALGRGLRQALRRVWDWAWPARQAPEVWTRPPVGRPAVPQAQRAPRAPRVWGPPSLARPTSRRRPWPASRFRRP